MSEKQSSSLKQAPEIVAVVEPSRDAEKTAQMDVPRVVVEMDAFEAAGAGENGDHIEYRTMGWFKAGALIMAETIALGTLSFPLAFYRLGMFAGVFTTVAMAAISWATGYVLITFKMNHPSIMNFADAGRLIGGPWVFWLFGVMLTVQSIFLAGSHALSGAIALNNISSDAICNVAWTAIIAIVSFLLTVPRTFEKLSYISFASVASIIVACLIAIIAVSIQNPGDLPDYPDSGPVRWKAFENHGLSETINAITNIVFAYGGHVAIFTFVSEMKEPADFKYSLAMVQVIATMFYVIVGAVTYKYGGQYVTSPALTMTSKPVRITTYAIALVSIIVAGVVSSYIAAKFVFITLFRGTSRLTSRSWKTWGVWIGICAIIWTFGFVIAEVIPFFSDLLSIISSVMSVWFTYGLSGVLWLYDNGPRGPAALRRRDSEGSELEARGKWDGYFGNWKRKVAFGCSLGVIFMAAVIMVLGLYSSINSIVDNYTSGAYGSPFTCSASS